MAQRIYLPSKRHDQWVPLKPIELANLYGVLNRAYIRTLLRSRRFDITEAEQDKYAALSADIFIDLIAVTDVMMYKVSLPSDGAEYMYMTDAIGG